MSASKTSPPPMTDAAHLSTQNTIDWVSNVGESRIDRLGSLVARARALEARANRPQIWKQRRKQRCSQICRARTTTCPLLETDGALNHLHMAIAPLLNSFVEVNEEFAHRAFGGMVAIHAQQCRLKLRAFDGRLRDIAREQRARHGVTVRGNEARECIEHCWRVVALLNRAAFRRAFCVVGEHARILVAEQTFELAKLPTLKAARARKKIAKRQKLNGRHRFKHIDLLHHRLENREHALERAAALHGVSCSKRTRESIAFVQLLLEPEFIHLMNDDEEHLIVLWLRA